MSNRMKFVRLIMIVALGAAIGITIKECSQTGSIEWQNRPVQPPANSK